MNKKIVLAHVAAIYIAMIGVGNATPAGIRPVLVEVTNTTSKPVPIAGEVTVVNREGPVVKIPAHGRVLCLIPDGGNICDTDIPVNSYPDGTNTFVFQTIAVEQEVTPVGSQAQYEISVRYDGEAAKTVFAPQDHSFLGVVASASIVLRHDNVAIYHDGLQPARVTFSTFAAVSVRQHLTYSGYYTYFPHP